MKFIGPVLCEPLLTSGEPLAIGLSESGTFTFMLRLIPTLDMLGNKDTAHLTLVNAFMGGSLVI